MYRKLAAATLVFAVSLVLFLCSATVVFAAETEGGAGFDANSAKSDISSAVVNADDGDDPNADADMNAGSGASDDAYDEDFDTDDEDVDDADKDDDADKNDDADKKSDKESAKEKAKRQAERKYRNGLAAYIRKVNPSLSKDWSRTLAQIFIDAGDKYDLDPTVLMALAQRESGFRAKVTSPYGYKGMMQTSDGLARKYGYKPSSLYKASVSIDVASRHLRSLKKSYGTYTMALCGYIYGGYAVNHGYYSKKPAWAIMNTRDSINEYLKKNDYV